MKLLGVLALPKNSTQKAGSKLKDEYDGECLIEAPSAVVGISRRRGLDLGTGRCANATALTMLNVTVRMVAMFVDLETPSG